MNASVQKFTPQARRALQHAQEEALRLSSRSIDTEHLLLGLIGEGDGTAARILASMGVELPKLRRAIEFISDERRRVQRQVSEELGLTPRVKRAIELAVDEARRLGHHDLSTEHLLLGLAREGEGTAAAVLQSMGVSLDALRQRMREAAEPAPARLVLARDHLLGRFARLAGIAAVLVFMTILLRRVADRGKDTSSSRT
uniref:Clp R domain-containing protein n=2 Tax=Thermorudis TaxID=1649508 RepID=A0A7C2W842_9BACT